jgi:hypothetical protein
MALSTKSVSNKKLRFRERSHSSERTHSSKGTHFSMRTHSSMRSESVEILKKSVKDQMKACLGYGKNFSDEIVQQFSVKTPGELDLDDVCQMLYN